MKEKNLRLVKKFVHKKICTAIKNVYVVIINKSNCN